MPSDHGVLTALQVIQFRDHLRVSAVSHRHGDITHETAPLGSLDGTLPVASAEVFRREAAQFLEVRRPIPFPRLEFLNGRMWNLVVPGTNILADITAENQISHGWPEFFGNIFAKLDG